MKKLVPMRPALGILAIAAAIAAAVTLFGVGGCTSSTTPLPVGSSISASPSPLPSGSPTPTPTPTPMFNVSVSYQSSPVPGGSFGPVDGYGLMSAPPVVIVSPSPIPPTPAPQGLIAVTAGQHVVFYNFDSVSRTAALLGPANGTNWPTTFTNTTCTNLLTTSPVGSAITDTQFCAIIPPAAGINPGHSLGYITGATTGSFYYADARNYCPFGTEPCGNAASPDPSMRTVITINP